MALGPGSIAFTGYNSDDPDSIAFVTFEDLPAGTVIIFDDNEWDGTAFTTGEGIITLTITAAVSAGSVIRIESVNATPTVTVGQGGTATVTRTGSFNLTNGNEVVYAYTGSASSPTFLTALANDGFTAANGVLTGTGLTAGVNAINLATVDPGADIGQYTGSRFGQPSFAGYRALINDASNWATQDGTGSQAGDGTSPDLPFFLQGFFVDTTPTLNINDVTMAEGDDGTVTFTFTVSLTAPAGPGGVTFDIATADGTAQDDNPATEDADYVAQSLTGQTIPEGSTTYQFDVTVNSDRVIEANETFFVNVTNVTGATVGDGQGQGTITNDDAGGAFSVGDVTVDEDAGTATVTITRTGGTADATIDYVTQAGSAMPGQDFFATGGTVVFDNGATSRDVVIQIVDDGDVDPGESFSVVISNPSAGTIDDDTAIVTITDDENPGALAIDDVAMAEGDSGATAFTFTVTRSGGSAGAVSATWTLTAPGGAGNADAGDFDGAQLFTGTVSFGAGDTISQTITIDVQGDLVVEGDEAFTVTLSAPTGGATISDDTGAGTIQNDDFLPAASIADASIAEGDEGVTYLTFTVTLDKPAVGGETIDFATADGTATVGSDYLALSGQISFAAGESSQTVRVPIIGDAGPEANETLTVTLTHAVGLTVSDGQATGTITNDDGPLYFALAGGDFSQDWANIGLITANDDWSGVPFIIGYLGDYTGASPTAVDPRTLTDASTLGQVDVIANQTNPNTNTSGGVAEFHIADPTIALQGSGTADAPSIVLYMDASGRQNIRFQANIRDVDGSVDNAVQAVAVQYRTDPNGSWINVPDGYIADATTGPSLATQVTAIDVTLPADANNAATLQIRVLTTNAAGSDEWVGIDDIVVSSALSPPSFSIANSAAFEGDGGTSAIAFTVTRAGDAGAAGTVDYAVSFPGGGFSASAADFASALSGTVAFDPGEASRTITLQIAGDTVPEADEAFIVTLSNPSDGSIADASARGTIVNDDGPPALVTIGDVTQAEGDSGTTIFSFTVSRTGGSGAFTINYETLAGTATEGVDYDGASGTLSFAEGEDSKTIEVTVNGDTLGELAETFTVQLSDPVGAVLADDAATGTIQNDDILFIHQIQGTSYYSPILAGEGLSAFNVASTTTVMIRAVVTAVDGDGPRQGFYLTEELADWDANSLTSEGIFVMTRNDAGTGSTLLDAIPGLQIGDLVTVTAQVMEYQAFQSMPRTMLVNPTGITINSSGNALPTLLLDASVNIPSAIMTAVTPDYTDSADGVGDTFDASLYALSFWETVEGMLVTIPDMVVADGFVSTSGGQPIFQAYSTVHADPDQINSRGGYTIAGDPPLSPPDTANGEDGTIGGGRHLHDGDVNPDIIEIDFSGFAIDAPAGLTQALSMGDRLGDVTGIVEFDFTDRKLFVTDIDAGAFVDTIVTQETTSLGNDSRSLTVATFNVENLDPGDGQARFDALAAAIANNLNAPDIISIEEIQDNNGQTNNGVTDASLTWQMLVDALNAAVPGAAYQWVDQAPVNNAEGGAGGGNIRVGFLYNTARVQLGDLDANASIEDRRKYTDRIGDGVRDAGDLIEFSDDMIAAEINPGDWSATRLSLLGQFTFNGNTVFVTANHFTAKGGSGEFWQIDQDLAAGEPANSGWAKRVAQANDVYTMLNHVQQNASTEVGIVAGGDFNDFYFYRPLEVLTGYVLPDGTARSGGARFDNLTLTLAEAERYTYTFDGRSQAIDHIIANGMLSGVATYDVVHLNTGYNGLGTGANASQRLSDHDPAVASFDFRSFAETLIGTAGDDSFDGEEGDDQFLLQQGGDDNVLGGAGNDGAFFGAAFDENDSFDGGNGNGDQLALRGEYVLTITGAMLSNVEAIALLSGADTSFGGPGNLLHSYDLSADDSLLGAGQVLTVNGNGLLAGESFIFDGSSESDGSFRFFGGFGTEDLTGGTQSDGFFFGAGRFDAATDKVNGGGTRGDGMDDQLGLRGDYSGPNALVFGEDTITNIETIALISSQDASYGIEPGPFAYEITTHDGNVAEGARLTVNANGLQPTEHLTFDGSAETDGSFFLIGGGCHDWLTGGAQDDILFGGAGGDILIGGGGNDRFAYLAVDDSFGPVVDLLGDFTLGDLIDLSRIDANDDGGDGDQAFAFIGDAAFSGAAGELRAVESDTTPGSWLIEADVDGDGFADMLIEVITTDLDPITATDFLL